MVEMTLVTGDDGRSVKHAIRVLDASLGEAALLSLSDGSPVVVTGELDYDASGAFVAVLDRRSCDLKFENAATLPVASKTTPLPGRQSTIAGQVKTQVSEPLDTSIEEKKSTDVVKTEASNVKEMPAGNASETVTKPVAPPKRMGLGGLRSVASTVARDDDEATDSEATPKVQQPQRTSAFSGIGRGAQSRSTTTIGADSQDDDIPF